MPVKDNRVSYIIAEWFSFLKLWCCVGVRKSEKQKNYFVLKSFEFIMIKLPKVSPFSKLRNPSMVTN